MEDSSVFTLQTLIIAAVGFGAALFIKWVSIAWNYVSNSKMTAKAQIYKNKEDIIKVIATIDQQGLILNELKTEGATAVDKFDAHKTEMGKLTKELFEKFEKKVESFEAKVEKKIDGMTKEIITALLDKL